MLRLACSRMAAPSATTDRPCHVWRPLCRDASRCYEAMCEARPWREGGAPLQLTFVGVEVYPPNTPQRAQVGRRAHCARPCCASAGWGEPAGSWADGWMQHLDALLPRH